VRRDFAPEKNFPTAVALPTSSYIQLSLVSLASWLTFTPHITKGKQRKKGNYKKHTTRLWYIDAPAQPKAHSISKKKEEKKLL